MEEMQLLHVMQFYLEGINQKRPRQNIYYNKWFVYMTAQNKC